MNPVALPLAAIVVMLWIIWSDSMRRRPAARAFYYIRGLLYLVMTGVLVYNLLQYPTAYPGSVRAIVLFAILVGLIGVVYFVRKSIRPSG